MPEKIRAGASSKVVLFNKDGFAIETTNPLPISGDITVDNQAGLVSTNNSTTALLGIDAVFTGVGDDVTEYSSVSVSWNANVASADPSGLLMQFSTDNVNWDRSIPVHSHSDTLQINHGGVHRLSIIAKFFRVVYTNGSVAQTSFRLQILYHTDNSMPLVSRISQQLNTDSDVALIRPTTNIQLDLARRQITGQRTFFFFGYNNDIDASVWEDVHPGGGDINWLETATKVEVLSTNAADTAAGLGTRSVEIHGLSATGVDQDEVIAMNGVTPVESSLTYVRINKIHNEQVGTYGGSHQGDITCRVTGAGVVLGVMTGIEGVVNSGVQYGLGEAGNGFYSVPLGKVAYLMGGVATINTTASKTADLVLYEREGILNTSTPFDPRRVLWDAIEVQGTIPIAFRSFKKIKGLTDIYFRAQASNNDTTISIEMEFFLVDANSAGE